MIPEQKFESKQKSKEEKVVAYKHDHKAENPVKEQKNEKQLEIIIENALNNSTLETKSKNILKEIQNVLRNGTLPERFVIIYKKIHDRISSRWDRLKNYDSKILKKMFEGVST